MPHAEKDPSTKESPDKKSEKIDKPPVDNASLALMLRKSADLVDKGEFDVILYHALQDFRTYYKQHLPKKKEKSSKKKTKIVSTTTTHIAAEQHSPEAKPAETKPAEATPAETTPAETTPVVHPTTETESPKIEPSAKDETFTASTGTAAMTATETIVDIPPFVKESDPPESPEKPITSESARFDSNASFLDSSRSVEEFSNEASIRQAAVYESSSPVPASEAAYAYTPEKPSSTSKITAAMFAKKMKLPKKLPKIHMQLPHSAKKKGKGKTEMAEVTGGSFAQQAEFSKRRTEPMNAEWCHVHQMMNCRCKDLQPVVTGMAPDEPMTTPTPEIPFARFPEIPLDRAKVISPTRSEPAATHAHEPPQEAVRSGTNNNAESALPAKSSTAAAFPSSLSDSFVSDPSPGPLDFHFPEIPTMDHGNGKPAFQRPKNQNSSLVANGWIEQQRRSKMRTVWKEVLASLVEGKRPGEETTLWIQREVTDATTGKKELEALHQIPVKLLESVVYSEYTTDDRFSLKLFRAPEEFIFRCSSDPSAAMNWVMALQKYETAAKNVSRSTSSSSVPDFATPPGKKSSFEEEKKRPDPASKPPPKPESTSRLAIRDLRAICHGDGINTAGMERTVLEKAAAEVQKRGTYFTPPNMASAGAPPALRARSVSPVSKVPAPASDTTTTNQKESISDLRAICHGDGISTVGMERGELQAAADRVRKRGTYFTPPTSVASEPEPKRDEAWVENLKKKEDLAGQQEELRRFEELRRKQAQASEEEARRRQAELDHRRHAEEESRRRAAAEEEHRRRSEDEARRRAAEEEHHRRLAEEEHRRRHAEQQAADQRRRYTEQQAAWQQQQQQEEQQRRGAEQHAAEQRRRHEEAIRKQQQWASQPQGQPQGQQQQSRQQGQTPPPQQQQQQWPGQPPQHGHPGQQQQQQWQQQQWQQHQQYQQQQQQQQQQQSRPQAPPPQQQQQQQHAQNESKYAKMANQPEDNGQAALTKLKHDILIQWALQPPQMQMLRSVDLLISTIHNVFPPFRNVPAHDYFTKWKPVTRESVLNEKGIIDADKLKKAVRKLRFFLHPDKLPKDLNSEQQFMVKMLWDIANDAWDEYEKSKADLDWIK